MHAESFDLDPGESGILSVPFSCPSDQGFFFFSLASCRSANSADWRTWLFSSFKALLMADSTRWSSGYFSQASKLHIRQRLFESWATVRRISRALGSF